MHEAMTEECALELVDFARVSMPNEACGFVLVNWIPMPCRNISRTPTRGFNIEPEILLEMFRYRRDDVLGIYHSHPSLRGTPSEDDRTLMTLYPGIRHWIVTTMNVFEWRMTDDGARPVRRNGATAPEGLACPLLASPTEVRREGGRLTA